MTVLLARAVAADRDLRLRLLDFLDDQLCNCLYTGPRHDQLARRCERCTLLHELTFFDLRSHEPPRNSGEGDAVDGPTPLAGGDDPIAPA